MSEVWEWPLAVTIGWSDLTPFICCYDGDTFRVTVDLGRRTFWVRGTVRLAGIDSPEIRSTDPLERERARAARDYLAGLLPIATPISLRSIGYDKYQDRVDADVVRKEDGLLINAAMVDAGHAVYRTY